MPWYFYNNRGVLKQPGIADALPVGLISFMVSTDFPTLTAPSGWLLCNGASYPTATYPELAAVLAYPGVPGVNFNVPNLSSEFPIGASGGYPLNSSGGTAQHPHTINSHSHTNTHSHSVTSTHTHGVTHNHLGGTHIHGGGPYNIGAATGGVTTLFTGAGLTTSSHGDHTHALTGNTGVTGDDSTANHTGNTNGAGSTTFTNVGGKSTPLDSTTPAISPVVDVLPPYLNTYCIIKAVDFSGTYI